MLGYKENIVVFGGGGDYTKTVKMRLTMNDMMIYDKSKNQVLIILEQKKWKQEIYYPVDYGGGIVIDPPKRRMHMGADFYGCMLMI